MSLLLRLSLSRDAKLSMRPNEGLTKGELYLQYGGVGNVNRGQDTLEGLLHEHSDIRARTILLLLAAL